MALFRNRDDLDQRVEVHNYKDLLDLHVEFGAGLYFADFHRVDDDLLIVFEDGRETLLRDYFTAEQPLLLVADGGVVDSDTVGALLRPETPLLYAQADGTAAAGLQRIGEVREAEGFVEATRPDGTTVRLGVGDSVYQGDILATGADGKIGVIFIDGTVFSLSENGRMTLNSLVFDPGESDSAMNLSVLQGTFVFLSGQIAGESDDGMTVRTPVATLGVRGTQVGGTLENGLFTLFPDEDTGDIGVATVINLGGQVVLDAAFESSQVTGFFNAPSPPFIPPASQIALLFSDVQQPLSRLVPQRQDFIRDGQDPDQDDDAQGDDTRNDGGGDQEGSTGGDAQQLAGIEPAAGVNDAAASLPQAPDPAEIVDTDAQQIGLVQGPSELFDANPGFGNEASEGFDDSADEDGGIPQASSANPSVQAASAQSNEPTDTGPPPAGFEGDDTIIGTEGDDVIAGFAGNDLLIGIGGNDTLIGGAGNDTLQGSEGLDLGDFSESQQQVIVDLEEGTANGEDIGSDVLANIENIATGSGNDSLVGDAQANQLNAGAGDDTLLGGGGNDTLEGGEGADLLDGGTGDDVVSGGLGDDTLVGGSGEGDDVLDGGEGRDFGRFTSTTKSITVDLEAGTASGSEIGSDSLSGLEDIASGSGDDSLAGDSADNMLDGGAGNDSLAGRGGDDTLIGGEGDDSLTGGEGNDRLVGGIGNDVLIGGAGLAGLIDASNALQTDQGFLVTAHSIDPDGNQTDASSDNLFLAENGIGVVGSTGNSAPSNQLGFDAELGVSEQIVVAFTNEITDAEVDVSLLFANEGPNNGDEVGQWQAFLGDQLVAEASFFASGDDDALTVFIDPEGDAVFDRLVLSAEEYSAGQCEITENSSDYFVTEIRFNEAGSGDDTLIGGEGDDQLNGRDGNDSLTGDAGDDALSGGAGDDTLAGGQGADQHIGGSGADRFAFEVGEDGLKVMENVRLSDLGFEADVIEDFDAEEGDMLLLTLEEDPDALAIALGNFEVIEGEYDGTNGTSEGWLNREPSLLLDGEGNLIYDDNGAAEGYTVVAQVEPGSVAAEDIQVSG